MRDKIPVEVKLKKYLNILREKAEKEPILSKVAFSSDNTYIKNGYVMREQLTHFLHLGNDYHKEVIFASNLIKATGKARGTGRGNEYVQWIGGEVTDEMVAMVKRVSKKLRLEKKAARENKKNVTQQPAEVLVQKTDSVPVYHEEGNEAGVDYEKLIAEDDSLPREKTVNILLRALRIACANTQDRWLPRNKLFEYPNSELGKLTDVLVETGYNGKFVMFESLKYFESKKDENEVRVYRYCGVNNPPLKEDAIKVAKLININKNRMDKLKRFVSGVSAYKPSEEVVQSVNSQPVETQAITNLQNLIEEKRKIDNQLKETCKSLKETAEEFRIREEGYKFEADRMESVRKGAESMYNKLINYPKTDEGKNLMKLMNFIEEMKNKK
jgi:hypothetical protein